MSSRAAFRVGTSGYQYDHWQGVLYPAGLPKSRRFAFYAERFDTVEVNNTFYRLPAPQTFETWRDAAPSGFRYSLKYSRYGTHMKRLRDPETHLPAFLEGADRLRSRCGPILVQLPPNWGRDLARLEGFLSAAPRRHRWVIEVRDPDWLSDELYNLLASHNVALCIHDLIADHPRPTTADWIYLRFHGEEYGGCYSHQALSASARRIRRHLAAGRDVYAYFNNDRDGHAVENARQLRRYVSA